MAASSEIKPRDVVQTLTEDVTAHQKHLSGSQWKLVCLYYYTMSCTVHLASPFT